MLSIKAKCLKHKRYNPAEQGENGITGGCRTCYALWEVWMFYVRVWRANFDESNPAS
jgi:hypothetical protein